MTTLQAISALACVGQLALVLVAVLRGGKSPLTLPLALLCIDLFTWNAADLAGQLTGQRGWEWLDLGASPLTTPLALDFVLAFLGQRRRLRALRLVCYAFFGLLAAASALAFVSTAARTFAGSNLWAALHLGGAIPVMAFAIALLVGHLRASEGHERDNTRLLIGALSLGALLGSTELWGHFLPAVPSLGPVGMLLGSALTTLAAMRQPLLERRASVGLVAAAVAIAAAGVLAYLGLFRLLAGNAALLVFATTIVSLLLMAATRQLIAGAAARRARRSQLTLLGRFSAQMAHDLKNPLAAVKGAAQFLKVELSREAGPPERRELVDLMLAQVDRLQITLDRYQRLSQVQLACSEVSINDLVREVLALQPFAAGGPITFRAELADGLARLHLDRELIAAALENLLMNSCEAMPGGGAIVVRTEATRRDLLVSVEDDGPGLDARTRERAFDELFTTKATGSGLGLPLVRRVAEAHGGSVTLWARQPRGTVVQVRLPWKRP